MLDLQDRENAALLSLEAQLRDVRTAINNIVKAVESGMANRTLQNRLSELEGEELRLRNDIEKEKALHPKLTEEQIRFMLAKYAELDTSVARNREKLIDNLIGSIILYDDGRLIITFNYRDKKVEANINEITELSGMPDGSGVAQEGSPIQPYPNRSGNLIVTRNRFGFVFYMEKD